MRFVRILIAGVVVLGAALLAAPAASADQIWHQGVARASEEAPCPDTSASEMSDGWSEWTPSWAAWPNGGRGGFVCTRSITWAHESTGSARNCVDFGGVWVDFGGGWSLPSGSPYWSNSACAGTPAGALFDIYIVGWVLAPDGFGQALDRCAEAFNAAQVDTAPLPPIYGCYNRG